MTISTVLLCTFAVLLVDGKLRSRYGHRDALFVARCEAFCWRSTSQFVSPEGRPPNKCVKSCLLKGFTKPGRCPTNATALSPFAAVCMKTCRQDSQCPGLTKCCRHHCGVTCQQPDDLLSSTEVPNIPEDVRVTETGKKRTIHIAWTAPHQTGPILYLIEERHHAGRNFIEDRLTEWSPVARVDTNEATLKNVIKPGRWYQFRVAAINEHGSKGFSENSPTFSASARPKPPKAPHSVTVGPLWALNGSLYAEVRWSAPNSDLPIQKYKVFWSRRLHGIKALDSVLVHQQVVPKDQTKFLLRNLKPNSQYFLQIQALVQFGKLRLKGEKSGLVLNTTNYANVTDTAINFAGGAKARIEGLHLEKLFWLQKGLRARVAWNPNKGALKYTVSWWTGPCFKIDKTYNHLALAATTKVPYFDLYDLRFNCRYRVSVKEVSEHTLKAIGDTSITFITPKCEDLKKNYKRARCALA